MDAQCIACLQWRNHIEKARKLRTAREDAVTKWGNEYSVRNADLQKVMMLPECLAVKLQLLYESRGCL